MCKIDMVMLYMFMVMVECEFVFFFFQAEDGIRDLTVTGVQTCALPISREVFDVTGAGDTVIATLALARAGGATMEESAILANHAAGIVVGKVGTAKIGRASCRERV